MSHQYYPQQRSDSSAFYEPALDVQQSIPSSFHGTVSDNQQQSTPASFYDPAFGNQQPSSFYNPAFDDQLDRRNDFQMVSSHSAETHRRDLVLTSNLGINYF